MPGCDSVFYILTIANLQNFSGIDYFATNSEISLWLFSLLGCDTVIRCVVHYILKDQNTFIFRVKQGKAVTLFLHWSFETPGATHQTTQHHILEKLNVPQCFCENIQSHFLKVLLYFYRYFMFKLSIRRFGGSVYNLLRGININLRR